MIKTLLSLSLVVPSFWSPAFADPQENCVEYSKKDCGQLKEGKIECIVNLQSKCQRAAKIAYEELLKARPDQREAPKLRFDEAVRAAEKAIDLALSEDIEAALTDPTGNYKSDPKTWKDSFLKNRTSIENMKGELEKQKTEAQIEDKDKAPKPEETREREKELTDKGSKDDKAFTRLGEDYAKGGSPKDSERVVNRALEINKDNPQAYSLRSYARAQQGRLDEALEDARKALERDPNNELAQQMKGYLDSAMRRVEYKGRMPKLGAGGLPGLESDSSRGASSSAGGSWAASRGGPAAVPGSVRVRSPAQPASERALGLMKMGDLTGALLETTRAIQADKLNPHAWTVRAMVSNKLKNYVAAVKDADEALMLDPSNVQALLERGYARYQLGNYQLALADLNKALELEPQNALAHLYRAMVLEKLSRTEEAVREYQTAAQLDLSLKPIADEALARLAGKLPARRPGRAPPWRAFLWLVALLTASAFILEGIKRVFKPGWRTTPAAGLPREEAPSPGTLSPGTVLAGNFRIEGELARGGMGIVYEATDLTLKRPVAIKHLRREAYESPEVRDRFLREAQLVAKLRHANLTQIYSVIGEGELYLVFELVQGESLDKTIARRGRVPLDEAKKIVRDVCGALDCAHSQKIIHRDLKPSNVMVEPGGTCKVMDFGIAHEARTMSTQTQTAAWGTPPYMAPEQEMGRVSRESDLYSLAVMTYEMLTGRRPFDGAYFQEKKLKGEYPPITTLDRGLPRSLDSFFAKALDPEPSKRFPTAGEFRAAFEVIGETPARPRVD